jgi:uracil permease
MIYNVDDKLPFNKLILFSLQIMLACFTATALIAQICGVPLSGAFVGAGMATIVYWLVTRQQSPMFISNSGAFVAPVLVALAAGGFTAVAVGGLTACLVYVIFGLIFKKISIDNLYKIMPKALIGSVTVVIGINLMGFISGYIGDTGNLGVCIALVTVLAIALSSHYLKGMWSMFPFLIGTLIGYVVAIPFGLVDFSKFAGISLFTLPDFAFLHFSSVEFTKLIPVIVMYIAFTISAICECLSDHAALGNIIGKDLYKNPGISRIFVGEGVANLASSCFGGLGACSYGESVGTIGFSKCAASRVTFGAAILMILLGFIEPIQAFIASIPSCVIGGGTACVLYGFISSSGIKLLKDVDLNNSKNLIIVSVVLSIGISGIALGNNVFSLSGTALALVTGIILNLLLKEKS